MKFTLIHKIAKKWTFVFQNYPLLSSSNFSEIVELKLPLEIDSWNSETIQRAKSIFVHTENLERLIEVLTRHSTCKYIFSGSSDKNVFQINFEVPESVKAIYIQNSFIRNNRKVHPLPIGIENIHFARNGFKWTMRWSKINRSRRLLVGPFGPTNQIREIISSSYTKESPNHLRLNFPINPLRFAKIHRRFSFTLCPRGNGEDTHRLWESIYRGSWPILERNDWSINISENYPVILVNSILDKREIFSEISKPKYRQRPTLTPALYIPYWKEILEQ